MLPVKSHLKNIYKDGLSNTQQHADLIVHLEASNRVGEGKSREMAVSGYLPLDQNNGTEAMG